MKKEFQNLIKTSINSLIKSGVVKSVTAEQFNNENRLIAKLKGEDSTYAEIIIGRASSKIIYKNGGLDERLINESNIVLMDDEYGNNLRFTTNEYTNLENTFEIEKDKKTKDLEAKQLSKITRILEDYWRDN